MYNNHYRQAYNQAGYDHRQFPVWPFIAGLAVSPFLWGGGGYGGYGGYGGHGTGYGGYGGYGPGYGYGGYGAGYGYGAYGRPPVGPFGGGFGPFI